MKLDPSSHRGRDDATEQRQADLYAALLQACVDEPKCTNFETWGWTDKYTWMGSDARPLPYDADFNAKKAADAMIAVLEAAQTPAAAVI